MKDFTHWNDIKIQTDNKKSKIRIREGEIRWCRVGVNVGNEILGKGYGFVRPVLILKKFSGDVFLGIPLTSKIRTGNWYYPVNHQDIQGSMILNQCRLFDKKRLENKLFEISDDELLSVQQAYCALILP